MCELPVREKPASRLYVNSRSSGSVRIILQLNFSSAQSRGVFITDPTPLFGLLSWMCCWLICLIVCLSVYFHIFQEIENSKAATDEFNLKINCYSANLVLPPKKGTAIMWYNNFIDPHSGLLGSVDRFTYHGGCDVIKGGKWIANNWLTAPTKYSRHIKSMFDVGFDWKLFFLWG